jgi:predicted secreted Zn-dependent protease
MGLLTPNTKYKIMWQYSFNTSTKTCSVISYSSNGIVGAVPTSLAKMPATVTTWPNGLYLQVQMGSNATGTPWAIRIGKLRSIWS